MSAENLVEKFCSDLFEKAFEVHKKGHLDIAETLYRAVIKEQEDNAQAIHFLGMALHQKGASEEALEWMEKAVELEPRNPLYHNNISDAYMANNRLDDAEKAAKKAIKLNKNYKDPYLQLGIVMTRKKQYLNALQYYRQALKLDPQFSKAHNNLGNVLRRLQKEESAFKSFEEALTIEPYYVDALNNIGLWYLDHNKPDMAISYFEQAIELKPNFAISHLHLSLVLLLVGQFERGWEEYEWRHLIYTKQYEQPVWDGMGFEGKTLLIHAEQGLGDTIQFVRYIPEVKKLGGKVFLQCPKALHGAFGNMDEVDKLIDTNEELPEFDLQIPLLTLARVFDTNLKTIPGQTPYLKMPQRKKELPQAENENAFKVGVVWSGNPDHRTDHYRSVQFQELKKFMDQHPDVTFYSFQKEIKSTENVKFGKNFVDCADLLEDFADTGILLSQCDLVITVDTSLAHIAGALNLPTWVFMSEATDWRWLTKREDSVWYPSMRLFRQEKLGVWKDVWQRMGHELTQLVQENNSTQKQKSKEKVG